MSNPDWNPYPDRWWLAYFEDREDAVAVSLRWAVMATRYGNNWHFAFPAIHHGERWKGPIELPMEYCL